MCKYAVNYYQINCPLCFLLIVTGLPSFASIHSIYIETGWEKLKTRREVRKLVLFYKIVNGQVPDYLTELVPPTVADTNNYNLRNRLNISQPSYRLSTYQQSYFPSTIKLWNTRSEPSSTADTLVF